MGVALNQEGRVVAMRSRAVLHGAVGPSCTTQWEAPVRPGHARQCRRRCCYHACSCCDCC